MWRILLRILLRLLVVRGCLSFAVACRSRLLVVRRASDPWIGSSSSSSVRSTTLKNHWFYCIFARQRWKTIGFTAFSSENVEKPLVLGNHFRQTLKKRVKKQHFGKPFSQYIEKTCEKTTFWETFWKTITFFFKITQKVALLMRILVVFREKRKNYKKPLRFSSKSQKKWHFWWESLSFFEKNAFFFTELTFYVKNFQNGQFCFILLWFLHFWGRNWAGLRILGPQLKDSFLEKWWGTLTDKLFREPLHFSSKSLKK